jgi:hypothetical protein
MENKIYPDIPIPNYSPDRKTLDQLNKSRIDEMKLQLESLTKDEKRYKKLLRRWKNTSKGITITGVVFVGVSGIASGIVLLPGLAVPLIIPGILGIIGVIGGTSLEGFNMGICSNRINHLDKKSSLVRSYIDKIYYYTEKANSDGVITIEEIEGFHKILDEYRSEIKGMSGASLSGIDKKLLKKAQSQADKEINEIFLQREKERYMNLRLAGNSNVNGGRDPSGVRIGN